MSGVVIEPARKGNVECKRAVKVKRFSVAEYHRLIEAGVLTEDDNLELLEGYLIQKKPHTPPHDAAIQKENRKWLRILPPEWDFRVQCASTLPESEPEPDIAIVRGDAKAYLTRHPTAADIGLVVEVSDSTLPGDRDDKGRIYARAGIPCYWIVNVNDRWIEVYTSPSGPVADPKFSLRVDHRPGDNISLILGDNAPILVAVQDMLP
jgi:Uma2 family endonuclease